MTLKAKPVAGKTVDSTTHSLLIETFEAYYREKLEVVADGAGKSRGDGLKDGWINGLALYRIINPTTDNLHPLFWEEINRIGDGNEVFQVLFNSLAPNAKLEKHIDGPPYRDRYHLVLTGSYTYWQDGRSYRFISGGWYGPISYWLPHAVHNDNNRRVTMIVDFND